MSGSIDVRLVAAMLAIALMFLSGCGKEGGADTAALRGEIKEAQQAAAQANQAAAGAQKAADEARKQAGEANQKADQMLANAAEMRKAIADLDEKMNRMFKKSLMK